MTLTGINQLTTSEAAQVALSPLTTGEAAQVSCPPIRRPCVCASGQKSPMRRCLWSWVADITFIRLETEFVYLAVVIDAFFASRDWLGAGPNDGR
jgi:hypothetical protein